MRKEAFSENWDIQIVCSERKSISLQIDENLKVTLRAPRRMSDAEIRRFLEERSSWIEKHMQKMRERKEAMKAEPEALLTVEELRERQLVFSAKKPDWEKHKVSGFATPSKKAELYSTRMKAAGYSPLPIPVETVRPLEDAASYPLTLTSRRPAGFIHTQLHNLSTTADNQMPLVFLGSADARRYGVLKGDRVTIETPTGQGVFSVRIQEEQQEGLLALDFGWGNPTDQGSDLNCLTGDDCRDPVSGGTPNRLFFGRLVDTAE